MNFATSSLFFPSLHKRDYLLDQNSRNKCLRSQSDTHHPSRGTRNHRHGGATTSPTAPRHGSPPQRHPAALSSTAIACCWRCSFSVWGPLVVPLLVSILTAPIFGATLVTGAQGPTVRAKHAQQVPTTRILGREMIPYASPVSQARTTVKLGRHIACRVARVEVTPTTVVLRPQLANSASPAPTTPTSDRLYAPRVLPAITRAVRDNHPARNAHRARTSATLGKRR